MKTIKVIDLYNKIANGEEVPEKIRYCSDLYEIDYRYMDYKNKYINDTYLLRDVISSSEELCNKIEVVEEVVEDKPKENKKILEELQTYKDSNNEIYLDNYCYKYMPINKDSLSFNEQVIVDKINEIIKLVKDLKE